MRHFHKALVIFIVLSSFRNEATCGQEVADRFDASALIGNDVSLSSLRSAIGPKLGNLRDYHLIAIFYTDDVDEATAIGLRNLPPDDKNPFGREDEQGAPEWVLVCAGSEQMIRSKADEGEVLQWKDKFLPVLDKPTAGIQLENLRNMKGFHDERHFLLFVESRGLLIGGKLFNPKEGTSTHKIAEEIERKIISLRKTGERSETSK